MRKFFIGLILLAVFFTPIFADAMNPNNIPVNPVAVKGQVLNETQKDVDFYTAQLYCDIRSVITGSFGTLVGLLISIAGGYTYLMKKSGYGLFFFFAGVALTALPGIFNWYYQGVATALGSDSNGSILGGNFAIANKVTLEDYCVINGGAEQGDDVSNFNPDHDLSAEKGVGLNSLWGGGNSSPDITNSAYYCFYPIDINGVYMSSANCTK